MKGTLKPLGLLSAGAIAGVLISLGLTAAAQRGKRLARAASRKAGHRHAGHPSDPGALQQALQFQHALIARTA